MSDWPPDGKKVCPTCQGDTLVDDAATAQHEEEYTLVADKTAPGMLRLHRRGEESFMPEMTFWRSTKLDALADPTKPVRIRLKLQAERIGE